MMQAIHLILLLVILSETADNGDARKRPRPIRCTGPKPGKVRSGCGYSCNRFTGQWMENICIAVSFDAPYVGLDICDKQYEFFGDIDILQHDTHDRDCFVEKGFYPKWCKFNGECIPEKEECKGPEPPVDPCQYSCDNSTTFSLCQVRHIETNEAGSCSLVSNQIKCRNLPRGCNGCDKGKNGLYAAECWRWDKNSPCPTQKATDMVIKTKDGRFFLLHSNYEENKNEPRNVKD